MSHWQSAQLAQKYSTFRPRYPAALFHDVLSAFSAVSSSPPSTVIDIGCGSGQAIQGLIQNLPEGKIHLVVGLDPSAAQLKEAECALTPLLSQKHRLTLVKGDAGAQDKNPLLFVAEPGNRHDDDDDGPLLVVSAQALHWISISHLCSNLFQLAERRQNKKIVFAAWNYNTLTIDSSAEAHAVLHAFDKMLLREGYWPKERFHIDNNYVNLSAQLVQNGFRRVPNDNIKQKNDCFSVTVDPREWTLEQLVNYLSTWSGVQKYVKAQNGSSEQQVPELLEQVIAKPIRDILMKEDNAAVHLKLSFVFNLHVFVHEPENKSKL